MPRKLDLCGRRSHREELVQHRSQNMVDFSLCKMIPVHWWNWELGRAHLKAFFLPVQRSSSCWLHPFLALILIDKRGIFQWDKVFYHTAKVVHKSCETKILRFLNPPIRSQSDRAAVGCAGNLIHWGPHLPNYISIFQIRLFYCYSKALFTIFSKEALSLR